MNTIYRLVWNTALGAWVVGSELSASRGKALRGRRASVTSVSSCIGGSLLLAMCLPGAAFAQALPPLTVSSTVTENGVNRDSASTPALAVTAGGDYTGTGVTLTSQAPVSGGNQGAVFVTGGGHAAFDGGSTITMQSSSPATVCCSYGIVADSGSTVDTAATVIGSTGGAGAYGGSRINLLGGSLSGLFGIVSSGAGSLITGTADISGSGAGTGVRAELGGRVDLLGGRVLSNGMKAAGTGSAITATGVSITGPVTAENGATVHLDGGSVSANGFGVFGVYAGGGAPSQITTSADVAVSGGGGGGAVAARDGSRVDVVGGNLAGSIVASGGGSVVNFQDATLTQSLAQGSVGVYVDNGGQVNLNGGTVLAPGYNNTTAQVSGVGSYIRNNGASIIGTPGSSVGALARQGGTYVLGAGGSMTSSTTGVRALDGGIIESAGTISAARTAAHASGAGSTVNINGGSLATTEYAAGVAAIMADSSGVVNVASDVLRFGTSVDFAGNGVMVQSGGTVNLGDYAYVSVAGDNATALSVSGPGSAINAGDSLTVDATGVSGKAIALSNGSNQIHLSHASVTASGANGVAVSSSGAGNALALTNASVYGQHLMEDDGNGMQLTADGWSVLTGELKAAASTLSLSDGAAWSTIGGQSAIGTLALDGSYVNVYSSDTPGTLQISDSLVLGAGGGMIGTRGNDFAIHGGTITGSGDLIVSNAGTLTVTSGMDLTGSTTVANADGTLQIGDGGAGGTVALGQVHNEGSLVFNRSDVVTVDAIDGSGRVSQTGSGTSVLSGDSTYAGQTSVEAGTLQLGTGGTTGSVVGAVDIGRAGTLALRRGNAVTLDNALTGAGVLDVDTQGEAFDFGVASGTAFTGTVALGNSTFQLGDLNTAALEGATLRAGQGSQVAVADGTQTIGGLSIQGGTLAFNARVPDQMEATSTIKTGLLDASGTGTISVAVPAPYTLSAPDTVNATNLLAQDDGNIGTRLVAADTVQGSGGALTLVDQDGNVLSDGRSLDIAQNGNVVARGDYDYRLTTAPGDGLYVNYGLTALDLVDGQTLSLAPDSTVGPASPGASDMSARISGQGNLAIAAGAGVVSLSNATNDYIGATQVVSGALRLDADNALGNTAQLALAGGTSADIHGTRQRVGAIDIESGASLDLGGGSLALLDGGRSAGELIGTGSLTVNGGTLEVQGMNENLAADVAIADGATVTLDHAAGLGNGGIANGGLLAFTGADDQHAFSNSLTGDGTVLLQDQSSVTVAGDNTGFAGSFEIGQGSTLAVADAKALGTAAIVDDGDLIVDAAHDWTLANAISGAGNVTKQGSAVLSIVDSLTHTGATHINEGVLRATQADVFSQSSAHEVAAGAMLDTAGFNQTVARLTNSGVVDLAGDRAGTTLTVTGDYVGNGGTLLMNTVLGDDTSATDKLVVEGSSSGNSFVQVANAGGAGAATENGIELIHVGGASEGVFQLQGRAVAGLYDYQLYQGGTNSPDDGNWYLRSEVVPTPPTDPVDPPVDPDQPEVPAPVLRPEPAAYLGNQVAALRMFQNTMHDRVGEPGLGAREDGKGYTSWARVQSRKLDAGTVGGQIDISTDASVVQVGAEKQFAVGEGRIHAGVMGGYGRATIRGSSNVSDHHATGEVKGRNVGVYGTWFQNADAPEGLYVDGVAQYGRFDNTVKGDYLGTEQYDSTVRSASLEAGYAFKVHEGERVGVYVEPQAQVIYSDFSSDDVREQNGTLVQSHTAGGTTTRLGARVYTRPLSKEYNRVQPYAAVNWWSGGNDATIAMDGERLSRDLPNNIVEVKTGLQLELGKGWSGWGEISQQRGSYGFKDTGAQIGVKLSW